MRSFASLAAAAALTLSAGCDRTTTQPDGSSPSLQLSVTSSALFAGFEPLPSQSQCVARPATPAGFATYQPFVLPDGYSQRIFASQIADFTPVAGTGSDLPDMNTLNETGPHAGRFMYRTHEVGGNGAVTVTDLRTGITSLAAQAAHYERLDGIVWTPWRTVLFAEEATAASRIDPDFPQAKRGLLYELDPATGAVTARPAVGSRSHEGLRFDAQGNLYGISESNPGTPSLGGTLSGGIFKFVPDRKGDLSSGQLYALKVLDASRTGEAVWVALDRELSKTDSDQAAWVQGATGWARPEDIEIDGRVMYVTITGEDLVLHIELDGDRAVATNYIQNVPGFENPDNLALDNHGNLYIAEDNGPGDIWVARAGSREIVRFASLSDCAAEPTGIYFDPSGKILYVNVQHAGGPLSNDLAMVITKD